MQADIQAFQESTFADRDKAEGYFLGSLLVSGDGIANPSGSLFPTPETEYEARRVFGSSGMYNWQQLAKRFNFSITVKTKSGREYEINPLLGTDAVHGNQHVAGSVLFPHNIGLACSHNPKNFYNAGYWTRKSVKESGWSYVFAPTVAG